MGPLLNKIKHNQKIQLFILGILAGIGVLLFSYFQSNPILPQLTIYFLTGLHPNHWTHF